MLRIGELSSFCGISIKALRYYDRIGLFKPIYIDPANNYRYYGEEQIKKLNLILDLRLIGLSLHDILKVMKNGVDEKLLTSLLSKARKQCEDSIRLEELKIENIDAISQSFCEHADSNSQLPKENELYNERLSRLVSLDSADSAARHAIEDAIWL